MGNRSRGQVVEHRGRVTTSISPEGTNSDHSAVSPHAKRESDAGVQETADASEHPRSTLRDQSVSIIMPALNEGHHIRANLLETARLFDRVKCDFEILVIDDGSTDNTREAS